MENGHGLSMSSSLSIEGSSCLLNGSSNHNGSPSVENLSLLKLSGSLEKLLCDTDYDYTTDAEIVVEGIPVGVHRCILAARSRFFHELFKKEKDGSGTQGKLRYLLSELLPYGQVGYEAFRVLLNYIYTGKLMQSPWEVATCIDNGCVHDSCGPAINYAVELLYASATFQVMELMMSIQRDLLKFAEKASVEDMVPILVAAVHCQLSELSSLCKQKIARSDLDSVFLKKELPQVVEEIQSLCCETKQDTEHNGAKVDSERKRRLESIYKALDYDDVELVKRLLDEYRTEMSLDDAFALHYAAAYCAPKVVKEVIALRLANVNLKNPRGYTVLHVAARRREPLVIIALLESGARASDTTEDGQTAVSICRKLTRLKDYISITKEGEGANSYRICVDVLEGDIKRNSASSSVALSSLETAEDLNAGLSYYESRVAFAKLLFPVQARLAMENADADSTCACASLLPSGNSLNGVDLQARLQFLAKTVQLGRRYFPNCSEVLDKYLADLMLDDHILEIGTSEEQDMKKRRYLELKEDLQKAFDRDMADNHKQSPISSAASSSSSPKNRQSKTRKKNYRVNHISASLAFT